MPSRRKTREFVLQVLFAADLRKEDPVEVMTFLENHFDADAEDEDLQINKIVKEYAHRLIEVVSDNKQLIDGVITKLSHNWKLHRIDRVDRNILRMAIAELTDFPEVPGRVILNEAIEISKKYGAENSPAFINGILDRLHAVITRPIKPDQLEQLITELDQIKTKG